MSLGVTASHKRTIKSGTEYNKYFEAIKGINPLLTKSADVYQTLDYIQQLVSQTTYQTAKISKLLKGASLQDTCRKVFNFCYQHIQYKLDKQGEEQLRTPARAWADRKTGIDCDCFSIFVSTILHNLGIKHAYRICEISNKGYFQHIYIVVPINQSLTKIDGQYITIDPVLDKFNLEAPGITKIHDKMSIPVRVLDGIEIESDLSGIDAQIDLLGVYNATKAVLKNHLKTSKNMIAARPKCLSGAYDEVMLLGAYDKAIQLLDSDSMGDDNALLGLMGLEDGEIEGINGLGELGKAKIFKKVAAAVKSVKTEVKQGAAKVQAASKQGAAKAQTAAKQATAKAKVVAKKAVLLVAKVNPVSTAARAGFLVGMKTNLFGMAAQLKWGYATEEQRKRYGISDSDYKRAKEALAKAENVFVNTLKGGKENLKNAILSGKNKLNGLGEPVTTTASVSAAMAFLLKVKDFVKGLNIKPLVNKAIEKIASKKEAQKVAEDVKSNLVIDKPETTIQNDEIVEKPNTGPNETQNDYLPPPPIQDSGSSEMTITTPQTESKGMRKGAMIGLGLLALLGIGYVATSGSKKGLGETDQLETLEGVKRKTRKDRRKTKTRTFSTKKGNKVKMTFSGAKKRKSTAKTTINVK